MFLFYFFLPVDSLCVLLMGLVPTVNMQQAVRPFQTRKREICIWIHVQCFFPVIFVLQQSMFSNKGKKLNCLYLLFTSDIWKKVKHKIWLNLITATAEEHQEVPNPDLHDRICMSLHVALVCEWNRRKPTGAREWIQIIEARFSHPDGAPRTMQSANYRD